MKELSWFISKISKEKWHFKKYLNHAKSFRVRADNYGRVSSKRAVCERVFTKACFFKCGLGRFHIILFMWGNELKRAERDEREAEVRLPIVSLNLSHLFPRKSFVKTLPTTHAPPRSDLEEKSRAETEK